MPSTINGAGTTFPEDADGGGGGAIGRFARDGRLAAAIAIALIPVVLLAWSWMCAWHGNREVHLINGTTVRYDVVVNGTTHSLRPKGRRVVPLGEGEITVHVQGGPFGEQRCVIETPFWNRPFLERTYVINPDRTAILVWEEASYSTSPSISAPDDWYEIRTGELLYEFAGLDYEFEAFPPEISMSRATEQRQRVDLLDEFTPAGTVMLLATELPPVDRNERVRRYLEDSLRFDPDCAECREALEAWVSGDDTTNTAAVGTP